ncbi:MAG TPA: MBOAT family O-acyltransferase [Kofleriaceae bacterium]|nr:MBOAT family O-acyltransferase [Kofleriaceae bacterium]
MQFNTYLFAGFFAVVLAVHHAPLGWTANKLALLVFSYVFYAAWDPAFVVLLWGSTVVDWFVARAMTRAASRTRRRLLLGASLAFNLGLIGYFKYADFAQRSIAAVLGAIGAAWHPAPIDIVLPIGISFYTFMTLSYTIDVYLGRSRPARSFLDYALYVTFFPHLVSGPIVRATELVPQFEAPRRATGAQLGWGLALLALGLFEKAVVADAILAPVVDKVYRPELAAIATADAWTGTLAFAGQIFCDFAGYSTCAIGIALCLGFALPDNFRSPYAAVGFAEFWRRWHISLSSWLRDYLYIPLGGNRRGALRTYGNLLLTMLIGGLWHGASWTFVAWGGLHGGFLIGERVVRATVPPSPVWTTTGAKLALALVTFVLVCVAWVFFRATSFAQAFRIVAAMAGRGHGAGHPGWWLAAIPVVALLAIHWATRSTTLESVVERAPWPVRSVVLAGALLSLFLFSGIDRAFIYFQF